MGPCRSHWPCLPPLRLTSSARRCPLSIRTLIAASACVVYLLFVASQVGNPPPPPQQQQQHRDRWAGEDTHRRNRLDSSDGLPDPADPAVPTRSNVVYITLRTKRLKPAHIRGTVRPKLRRKARRAKSANSAFTQNKLGQIGRNVARTPWGGTGDVDYTSLDIIREPRDSARTDPRVSSIRIYSRRAPPWLGPRDVEAMRFLAGAAVLRVREVPRGGSASLLLFEGETTSVTKRSRAVCGGRCGVIGSPLDSAEVFAFHLDRVLGLNRTLPAVSRRFSFLLDGQPCPVVSWDASLYPEGLAVGESTVRLTWGEYQSSLKQRCWHKNVSPKPDSGCSTVHHYEWSKLALFDFLLQIHNRLDHSCCGFRPRQEDVCVELGHHAECGDQSRIQLTNIIHRGHDPRHLVFTSNKGFFDRNEDNLDFRLLEGIKELPEQAVSVLRSRRLREKLLQSLFLDQIYWESQGGRQGIDKLIDVIERRAKFLLTYINAHGIKVITMNVR